MIEEGDDAILWVSDRADVLRDRRIGYEVKWEVRFDCTGFTHHFNGFGAEELEERSVDHSLHVTCRRLSIVEYQVANLLQMASHLYQQFINASLLQKMPLN